MYQKIKTVWSDWNQNIVVNKRELLLGLAVCTLAGTVLGMLVSPRKTMTIGSNNGSNNVLPNREEPSVCEEAAVPECEEV